MKVLIIEDEVSAKKYLIQLLNKIDPNIEIVKTIDSVKSAVKYLKKENDFELIFMDIQLGDGICFEIFEQTFVDIPIIFTTAYDQYAIEAFKVNSVYYLLKPIKEEDLENALLKFKKTRTHINHQHDQLNMFLKKMQGGSKNKHTTTFLISDKNALLPIKTKDFSFFFIESNIVRGVTFSNKSYALDKTISELEEELDSELFYRVNRQLLVNRNGVDRVYNHFYGKVKIDVTPEFDGPIIISKAKVKTFKSWLVSH
ncbi:LytR/AlgR family response regulator transcription factor [Aquimarina aggregata]|uniref:LytR/AlgR family response regulator transcription factor n=1 Tax=Aquimarina aggregata TaxID=1642818 RepID=UPI00249041B4|nr:response regulator transcription factor [Aquimarina aggregata]